MAGALLVPHQNMLDVALLENLVIDRKHRAAGIAEQMLDAMIDERAHDHRGAGHLVRIVALVGHGLLRMRCWRGFLRFGVPGRDDVSSKLHLALSSCLSMIFSENRFPLFRIMLQGIKKGPKRPHAHRLNLGWPQPPPAVRLGTTTIRSLVIILRIRLLGLPKGCAVIPPGPRKSREGRHFRDLSSVAVFRAFGE